MSRRGDDSPGRAEIVEVPELAEPIGYSHGTLVSTDGRLLAVSGQVGWDETGELVAADLAPQFGQALANVVAVVTAAGGVPGDIFRLRIYVVDRDEYVEVRPEIGQEYRRLMGRHFPATTLVEVATLLEPGAKVEIEADAAVPAALSGPGGPLRA